jgi:DNA-binding MarR family transcriptional regulator
VEEGVRRIVMGGIDNTARRLLREMGYQAEGNPSEATNVVPREAAESLDLDPGSPEYTAALNHLLELGFIEPKTQESDPTERLYRLTEQGLRRAREIRWR